MLIMIYTILYWLISSRCLKQFFFYGCLAEPSGWQWKEWGFNQQQ